MTYGYYVLAYVHSMLVHPHSVPSLRSDWGSVRRAELQRAAVSPVPAHASVSNFHLLNVDLLHSPEVNQEGTSC